MERARLVRRLRIAVSAVCVVVCVGLMVLWVRSYSWWDAISGKVSSLEFGIQSVPSHLIVAVQHSSRLLPLQFEHSSIADIERGEFQVMLEEATNRYGFGYGWHGESALFIPYWFLVALSAALAFVPWLPWHKLRWQFSLRTLLIVTALVAVVLGLVVRMVRG